ncbi:MULTISPECIES: type I-E CRISPR-associated protein Cse2/CasB [Arthrobacter]|uniref:Type I-E CRISPR-associated protein Cse2/CasB n=2 Tax=Arthrobacter TaxID=1663 RepID=A0ABU9KMA2_9MICC|nr:type I-E CRISPR-associated protein Cse2/CasB [Arthrobacter sp. YJM1]MDP5227051.1 type I-E CRISPR-associated protein Cse2/CasB [Arthrobacter sp. YJM1]
MNEQPDLVRYVSAKISRIQGMYFGHQRSDAAAVLAKLRRGVAKEPGADTWAWGHVVDGLPKQYLGRTDSATSGEKAAYVALTLYAVHQQSKTMPMHRPGPSMGRSIRQLGAVRGTGGASDAVKRRFDALMSSATFNELQHHARGLIQQLRAADIPLDYGRLAEDIRLLQSQVTANGVQLRWGRDYAFEEFGSEARITSFEHEEGNAS